MLTKIIETHKVRLALITKIIVEKCWQKLSEYTKWIDNWIDTIYMISLGIICFSGPRRETEEDKKYAVGLTNILQ